MDFSNVSPYMDSEDNGMQYILSKDEYDTLVNENYHEVIELEKQIADLCRVIANINFYSKDLRDKVFSWEPHTGDRCIRDGGNYCTGCPIKDTCTYDYKVYAK